MESLIEITAIKIIKQTVKVGDDMGNISILRKQPLSYSTLAVNI